MKTAMRKNNHLKDKFGNQTKNRQSGIEPWSPEHTQSPECVEWF